ncbi:bucentaur or craniofacial development-domain-containing protein [Kockovaella imperatae]|uniref:SWR1-complex protein 5 n=1 Tax=Kockovaella imperatae TaxID=4999 RepID=A0A1Y1UFY8_9TREE|nr:bucentaur or craniofacial development-domain-containing protein [Kockovaella imperatae]ORX36424.1 bucentaur or craniofacial development-domain-containing protein [Kockovaella imperatae]
MPSFANADLGSSSDEEDHDFVPDAPKSRAKNGKRAPSTDGDDLEVKRLKQEQEENETAERKKQAAEAFEALKRTAGNESEPKSTVEMVEVKRSRRFAGENLEETVNLPADHPEAIAYLNKGRIEPTKSAQPGPRKGPLKRKPRQSLEQMSAALDKGKKMTTLEKSQHDWKNHTAANSSVQAELEAHRRTGGYLDKQDFLDRVGDRKEAMNAKR